MEGGCVLPGFSDAHVHFPSWALARRELRLQAARSLGEAVALVERAAADAPPGTWVRGRGWRSELWPAGDEPTRHALDAVSRGVRVALRAHDGHSLWLNSAALDWAGGDLETPGGVVERDAAGEPTGILRETAAWRFEARAEPGRPETLQAMREALPAAAAAGVVAVHDKDGGRHAPELFAALRDEGALTLRVWQSLPADRLGDGIAPSGRAGRPAAHRLREGLHGRHARLPHRAPPRRQRRGDHERGGAGARSSGARPRPGSPWRCTPSATARTARRSTPSRPPAPTGAGCGRGSSTRSASIPSTSRASRRSASPRPCSTRTPPATATSPTACGASAPRTPIPTARCSTRRTVLAGGSDAPVEELDPLAGLRAAVRRTDGERPPWRPEQAIGAAAALASYTTAPAWLAGEEELRGRLAPGLLADLVVLDRDPLADLDARVLGTMLAGRWTLRPPGSA